MSAIMERGLMETRQAKSKPGLKDNEQLIEQNQTIHVSYSNKSTTVLTNNNWEDLKDYNLTHNPVGEIINTHSLKTDRDENKDSILNAAAIDNVERSDQFRPKSALKENRLLDYVYTCIYAHMTFAAGLTFFALVGLVFTSYYYISLIYFGWLFLDRNTCNQGGRRWNYVYHSEYYKRLANYFPIKMRYSKNFCLDPSENYLLNYHPHGISAFGCVAAFGTDALNFSERFPGMTSAFLVHETSFLTPIMKEVFAMRGDCSVNSKSIDYLLSKSGKKGHLLALVVGGLAEMDLSDTEILRIVVAKRKGFVKKALQHGAHIIPCIGFGENSVFKTINIKKDSFTDRFRNNFYRIFGFKHPFYYGESIFNHKWAGLVPYQRPITVTMGDPIMVTKCECPTQEQIDDLHSRYLEELMSLYKSNSELCQIFDKQIELV